MTIMTEIVLITITILTALFCPFIQWELFVNASTLKSFNNEIFILLIVLLVLTIIKLFLNNKLKFSLSFITLTIDSVIIYKINNSTNFIGVASDGTKVIASKMYGFYIISAALIIYLIFILFDILKNFRLNRNIKK